MFIVQAAEAITKVLAQVVLAIGEVLLLQDIHKVDILVTGTKDTAAEVPAVLAGISMDTAVQMV